ncbi:MAG: hypothetical protein MUC36_23385 [Planctomycetes bacterium]|jgi:hypothetical protein|nr:hypothetical protein [Planctomycetota bacterium]
MSPQENWSQFASLLLACAVSSSRIASQEPSDDSWQRLEASVAAARALHAAGKPVFEWRWIVRADGTLTQQPRDFPDAGPRKDFFGDEEAGPTNDNLVLKLGNRLETQQEIRRLLATLLRVPGDLLGTTSPERHFTQLGIGSSDVELRQLVAVPEIASTPALRRRELLDRELAVRCLQHRNTRSAIGELRALAKNNSDPFLQHAIRAALHRFGVGEAPARVALPSVVTKVAAGVDLWLWCDFGQFAMRPDVAAAEHAAAADRVLTQANRLGDGLRNIHLASIQHYLDYHDEVGFEAARTWGRARIDQCLLGFRIPHGTGERLRLVHAAASGAFEVDVLASHLQQCEIRFERKDGRLRVDQWWPGYTVAVAADHLVVSTNADTPLDLPAFVGTAIAAGDSLAIARAAQPDRAWSWLEAGATAAVRLVPFRFTLSHPGSLENAAELGRQRLLQLEAMLRGKLADGAQLAERWQRALVAAGDRARVDGDRVHLVVEAPELDPLLLWPLLVW